MNIPLLAVRSILRNRTRTLFTVAAIALGVGGLIVIAGFVEDLFTQLAEVTVHAQLGHVQVYRAGYYEHGSQQPSKYYIEAPAELDAIIARTPQVTGVLHRLNFHGLLSGRHGDLAIAGEGGEPSKEAQLGTSITVLQGRALADRDRFGMMIGSGVAKTLKLVPGDRANLVVSTEAGAMNALEFEVVGIFRTFSKEYDDRAVRISLAAAQELLNTEGVNAVVVSLAKTADTDRVAAALRPQLAAAGYDVKTWKELSDFYEKTVRLFEREYGVLNLIVLAMILLTALNAVNLSMFERSAEFGTVLALGATRKRLFALLTAESLVLGVVGALTGVMVGCIVAAIMSSIGIPMPPPPNSETGYVARVPLVPSAILTAFAAGALAVWIAGLLSAYRAARLDIAEALRQWR